MKRTAAHFALLIPLLVSGAAFNLAQAQTLAPATRELVPVSINAAAIPAITNPVITPSPVTAEPPPAGTVTGAQTDTQQTEETATGTTADPDSTTSSRDTTSAEEPTEEIYYPDAELPVLDLESSDGQTQESSGLLIPSTTECLDSASAGAAILPSVTANQIRISLLVFLGAIMGTLLFVLSNFLINSARGQREILRLERQNRLAVSSRRLEILADTYGPLTNSLSQLLKPSGNRLILDPKALAGYKSAAADIEMFGSDKSLKAHQKLSSLLSQAKLPPLEEIESAKTELIAALQQDLGLNQLK